MSTEILDGKPRIAGNSEVAGWLTRAGGVDTVSILMRNTVYAVEGEKEYYDS